MKLRYETCVIIMNVWSAGACLAEPWGSTFWVMMIASTGWAVAAALKYQRGGLLS